MIKHLSGDYETVEYENKRFFLLHDNYDNEAYPIHWHNAVEILMPLENKYIVNTPDSEYVIPVNDVLIIPPAELHSMPAVPGHRLILQFDNSVLNDVPAFEPVMRGLTSPVIIDRNLDKSLHSLAKKTMLNIYELNGRKSELADVKIYTELINLLIAVREFRIEQARISLDCDYTKIDEYSEKFSIVMKYIDSNYMYDISLQQLADIAGYSKYHFSRIFKQYNSMSYLQYINARRTKAAEMLLLESDISMTEVAMRSGFRSLTTFNRIFKEIKHCTPTDFKKLYSED
ncbi:MAG: AraC family transcriptional regulator [Ruminococcus flavefaciens]|nr:AraC family transcriptional regulator [Ruminococcus flavefaciens]MCM1230446.1 AraC family transcriptional regulator [Ruminococcus flavefaciens]